MLYFHKNSKSKGQSPSPKLFEVGRVICHFNHFLTVHVPLERRKTLMKTVHNSGCPHLNPWARFKYGWMMCYQVTCSYFSSIVPKTWENDSKTHPWLGSEKKILQSTEVSLFSLNEFEALTCVNPNMPMIR